MVRKQTVYLCDVCDSQFSSRKEAEEHEKIPVLEKKLPVGLVFRNQGSDNKDWLVILANKSKVDENHNPRYSAGHIRPMPFARTSRLEYHIIINHNYSKREPDYSSRFREEDIIPVSDKEFKKIIERLKRDDYVLSEVYHKLTNVLPI